MLSLAWQAPVSKRCKVHLSSGRHPPPGCIAQWAEYGLYSNPHMPLGRHLCEMHKLHNCTCQSLHVLIWYVFLATFIDSGMPFYIRQANQSPSVEFFPTGPRIVSPSLLVKVKRWILWTIGDWDSYHWKKSHGWERMKATWIKEQKQEISIQSALKLLIPLVTENSNFLPLVGGMEGGGQRWVWGKGSACTVLTGIPWLNRQSFC